MERIKRTRRNLKITRFDQFPTNEVEESKILADTRNMDYLSKFREFHVKTVFYLALLGLTNEQMAHVFEISIGTFSTWLNKYDSFREAVQKGKEQADAEVVYSLYQSAVGYEHDSEQIFMSKERIFGPDGKVKKEIPKIVRVPIRKKYPPNVKAAIKWLEIRQPAQWTNREIAAKTIDVKHSFDLSGLSDEELRVLSKVSATKYLNPEIADAQVLTTVKRELSEKRFELEDNDNED